MKRRVWWLALFAPQAVPQQRPLKLDENTVVSERAPVIAFLDPKNNGFLGKTTLINNQCPVCGTMASPYKWQPENFCGDSIGIDEFGRAHSLCERPAKVIPHLTRCEHCNAAFWQDDGVKA